MGAQDDVDATSRCNLLAVKKKEGIYSNIKGTLFIRRPSGDLEKESLLACVNGDGEWEGARNELNVKQ